VSRAGFVAQLFLPPFGDETSRVDEPRDRRPTTLVPTALEQARAPGRFTPVHKAWWAAACKAHGDADGTRALIEVLMLYRHLPHEHVVAGLATALRAGALTADAVALEAHKYEDISADTAQDTVAGRTAGNAEEACGGEAPPVRSLTERRWSRGYTLTPVRRPSGQRSGTCRALATAATPGRC
jgi:hypothetical protein